MSQTLKEKFEICSQLVTAVQQKEKEKQEALNEKMEMEKQLIVKIGRKQMITR